ncbi:MAG TPA: hypothetical protein VH209_02715 [Steroidobacteraceae bacterium]|jgi:hypothetical protein|nr:hypothetical protein [Steroidobacteraceae bacterium]
MNQQTTAPPMYEANGDSLRINHNAGFFSCCTVRLEAILDYFRSFQRPPRVVDSSQQFAWYKRNPLEDVTPQFFKTREDVEIPWTGVSVRVTDVAQEQQFSDYSRLNYPDLKPFVERYFTPSDEIVQLIEQIERSSPVPFGDICSILFRGGDKKIETVQPSFAEVVLKAVQLRLKHPQLRFLVQSDEPDFLEYAQRELEGTCFFVSGPRGDPMMHISLYLASIMVISRSRFVISTSGNGEMWVRLFRGHAQGTQQFLAPKESIYGVKNPSYDPSQKYFWLSNS